MYKLIFSICLSVLQLIAVAQFAPPVGQIGTTAMYKDSSAFKGWATACSVIRGYQNIADSTLGFASSGDSSMAIGMAGTNGVVSLGDGGIAILTFTNPISNGLGSDFAVFEIAFTDTYLELAFVDVSSDGINYFRFPATSNTQDSIQVDGFGSIDATKIDNLAGKYRALYGTPFELDQLSSAIGLDANAITHVRITDVVGSIQYPYARYDRNLNKINELWSTPYPSSGFDLDAVGVINSTTTGINRLVNNTKLNIYPNPASEIAVVRFYLTEPSAIKITISDITGKEIEVITSVETKGWQDVNIPVSGLKNGIYLMSLSTNQGQITKKLLICND